MRVPQLALLLQCIVVATEQPQNMLTIHKAKLHGKQHAKGQNTNTEAFHAPWQASVCSEINKHSRRMHILVVDKIPYNRYNYMRA